MLRVLLASAVLSLALASSGNASPVVIPTIPTPSENELASILRGMLLNRIPDPLYSAAPGWGKQVPSLVDHKRLRNDGAWRKIRATALNPAETLLVEVRNVRQPEPSKMTFDLLVACDVEIEFLQQIWERGVRLYSGSTKARCKVWTALTIEVTTRFEGMTLLPDLVFQIHVAKADVRYSKLDVIHTAGIGGDGAKLLGEAVEKLLKELNPSLQKELLQKADAAIMKAGECKEVRISLSKLLKLVSK